MLIRHQSASRKSRPRACRCPARANGSHDSGSATPRATKIGDPPDGAPETRRRAARRSGSSRSTTRTPHGSTYKPPTARLPSHARSSRSGVAATAHWLPVPTTSTADGFSGRLDDENLPNGIYDLRARAFDSAGNEQSTTQEISGDAAARRVPERINTRLVAGQVKHVTARRSRGGKRRTRRVIVVRPTVPYGHTIPIRGRLTMPGGNPVAEGAVEVWEQTRLAGAVWRRIALIDTDAAGRFKFKALRGPSRVLRFRYPGTALVRARTTEVEIKVTATSTLQTSRTSVVNGDEIVLRGRVLGQPAPSGREACPAPGLLARELAYVRHTTGQRHKRALELSIPVHRHARHRAVSLPCPRS